jgi:ABC-type uncharacterized transport system involved in gliding motility auxiliary subunit
MTRQSPTPGRDRWRALAAVPVAIVLFVAINVLAEALPASVRLDVTANQRHTLSDATRRSLAAIPEPVTLRLYISPAIRDDRGRRGAHADRVLALLRRYERLAGGGLSLKVLHPEPFSETEDQALADGLNPVRIGPQGRTGYFGLAGVNSTDDREIIPSFDPARAGLLEADLTRLIHNLAHPRKPVVGLIGRIGLENTGSDGTATPNRLRSVMGQQFDLRRIDSDAETLPADLDALMLVQPTGLSARLRDAIRAFVAEGGAVAAYVDPLSESLRYRRDPASGARPDTSLDALLAQWGVRLTPERFVADRDSAVTVRARVGGRDSDVPYVGWLRLDGGLLADTHAATAGLGRLMMKSPGNLDVRRGGDVTLAPLATSSARTALLPVDRIAGGPRPAKLLADFPEGEALDERVLAAEVKSAARKGRVIVVADTDLLQDTAWLPRNGDGGNGGPVPVADNGTFALNILETLTGGPQLSGLGGGTRADRPFTLIQSLQREAEQRYRQRETRLIDSVREAREGLRELHERQAERGSGPTAAERERMAELRETLSDARRKLRDVQHKLHADVTRLQTRIRVANVWGVPALVALAALLIAFWRWHRRRRRAQIWRQPE